MAKKQKPLVAKFAVGQYVKIKGLQNAPAWKIVELLTEKVGDLQINRLYCECVNNCTGQTMCNSFNYSEVEPTDVPSANYQ